jgi:3-dehydroquinate synthase
MVMANSVAVSMGWMTEEESGRVKALLERYDLPTSYPIADVDKFYETFYLDKKSADSSITFIIPKHLGGVEITDAIEPSVIKDVLDGYKG